MFASTLNASTFVRHSEGAYYINRHIYFLKF